MSLVSDARLYDAAQRLFGYRRTLLRLQRHFDSFPPGALVLDFGGGTGAVAPCLPAGARYICLDNEWGKLERLRFKISGAPAVLGDATCVPVRAECIDVALSIAVSHHLNDSGLHRMLSEARRVLKPGGLLVFLDALAGPRIASKALWSIDRGSYPRRAETLEPAVKQYLTVIATERHTILHEYFTILARKESGERHS